MTVRMISFSAIALACAMMAAPGFATSVYGPVVEFDGRHYQVVKDNGVSWDTANANAQSQTFAGVAGHLATLTSAAEDNFVESLRAGAGLSRPEVWVGGFQESCTPPEPGCGWQWVNGEGPISTPDVPLLSYSNWQAGEPNNLNTEMFLAIGLGNNPGWNDEQALGNIGGYVIEFDTATVVDPDECLAGDGCPTTTGQTLLLPPVDLGMDASIGVRTFEFTDNPARCGVYPLTLFGGAGEPPALIIPPYLCGSPKFLVVEVDTDGFEVLQGTVLVENDPEEALPDNLYDCTGPFLNDPLGPDPLGLDPQHRDVVAWQATNFEDMLETDIGATVDPMFEGSLGEFTHECGSSRGKIKSASYYVIGLHIDFGTGYDLAENSAVNHDMFVALTGYKLELLQASVVESRPALHRFVYRAMLGLVNGAIRLHDRGRFSAALLSIRLFLLAAENVAYATIPGENYNGEHLMRGSNIQFTYEEKVIPFAP